VVAVIRALRARLAAKPKRGAERPLPSQPPAGPQARSVDDGGSTPPAKSAEQDEAAGYRKKLLEERLAHLSQERGAFLRDAKLSAIVLVVLLILVHDYISLVAADFPVERQYAAQAQSLIALDGEVSEMNDLVERHEPAWRERFLTEIEAALLLVVALDAADPSGTASTVPRFVEECAQLDAEAARLLRTRDVLAADARWIVAWSERDEARRSLWEGLAAECIFASIGADYAVAGDELAQPFVQARNELATAIAEARMMFPAAVAPTPANRGELAARIARTGDTAIAARGPRPAARATPVAAAARRAPAIPVVPAVQEQTGPVIIVLAPTPTVPPVPSPTPGAAPLEAILEDVERRVADYSALVAVDPTPGPTEWVTLYAGEGGTLRSFRDNLLLAYANPFGALTTRDLASVRQYGGVFGMPIEEGLILYGDVFPRGLFEQLLNEIREKQEELQARSDARTSELESAVPDFARPVLAVARPKYLVHLYPFLVAGVGTYLLINFINFRRDMARLRRELGLAGRSFEVGSPGLPWILFIATFAATVGLLSYLYTLYGFSQFTDVQWGLSHRELILGLIVVVCSATAVLLVVKDKTEAELRPGTAAAPAPKPPADPPAR
jgi:hypothetical protein